MHLRNVYGEGESEVNRDAIDDVDAVDSFWCFLFFWFLFPILLLFFRLLPTLLLDIASSTSTGSVEVVRVVRVEVWREICMSCAT